MNATALEGLRQQWQANRRLRVGGAVILAVLALQAHLMVGDHLARQLRDIDADANLLRQTSAVTSDASWMRRAESARLMAAAVRQSVPEARTRGEAQAEMRAWLEKRAASARLEGARVQIESALDVPDHAEVWQVPARMDVTVPPFHLGPFLRSMTQGLPWVRVESLQVQGGQAMQATLVVRGYFRKPARDAGPALPAAVLARVAPRFTFPEKGGPAVPADGAGVAGSVVGVPGAVATNSPVAASAARPRPRPRSTRPAPKLFLPGTEAASRATLSREERLARARASGPPGRGGAQTQTEGAPPPPASDGN